MNKSTAIRAARTNVTCTITFKGQEHENFHKEYLPKRRCQEVYHEALIYCLGISKRIRKCKKIYCLKTGCVKTESLWEEKYAKNQTSRNDQ